MTATIAAPPMDDIARRWHEIEPLLKRATDLSAAFEPIDLLRACLSGQMAIWLIEEDGKLRAVLATQIRQYPRCRVLELLFVGGDGVKRWHGIVNAAMDAHAKECGCGAVQTFGRPGWAKFGFDPDGTIFTRRL